MAPPRRSRRLALKHVRIGDLPTNVLTGILLTATTHENLLAHAALCARVHPEWRRAVMGSAAYGRGIVGRSADKGATETAATEALRALNIGGLSRRAKHGEGCCVSPLRGPHP